MKTISLKKQLLSLLFMVSVVGLTCFAIGTQLKELSLSQLFETIKKANGFWLGGAVLCTLGFFACEGGAMCLLGKIVGYQCSYWRSVIYSGVEIYFSAITPSATGGQPAAVYIMSKDNINPSKTTIGFLLNTCYYTVSLMILGVLSVLFYPQLIFGARLGVRVLFFIGIALNILVVTATLGAMHASVVVHKGVNAFVWLLYKIKLVKSFEIALQKVDVFFFEYKKASDIVRQNPKGRVRLMGLNLLQRILIFSVSFCVCKSIGIAASLPMLLALQSFSVIAVGSLPLPGGVGAAEGVMLALYAGVFGKMAVVIMVLSRAFSFYLSLLVSGVMTLGETLYQKRQAKLSANQPNPHQLEV